MFQSLVNGAFCNSADQAVDLSLQDIIYPMLQEKTGLVALYLEQLENFGGSCRDNWGWQVTVVFNAMVARQACPSHVDTVDDVRWIERGLNMGEK